jgi:hypothetical protein
MKSLTSGTISGCLTWVILFVVSIPCVWPLFFITLSLATHTDFSYQLMQPILCPAGTTLKVRTFDTTTTDSSHHSIGAVGHDMNCVDANDNLQKKDVIVEYLLWWRGFGIIGGAIISALLAFLLAAPAGVLVARFFGRTKVTPAA